MKAHKDPYNKLLAELRELTETNQHPEALLQIAKYFKLRKLAKAFEAIETLHIETGSMQSSLHLVRATFKSRLFNWIEQEHGTKIRKQIYNCL